MDLELTDDGMCATGLSLKSSCRKQPEGKEQCVTCLLSQNDSKGYPTV